MDTGIERVMDDTSGAHSIADESAIRLLEMASAVPEGMAAMLAEGLGIEESEAAELLGHTRQFISIRGKDLGWLAEQLRSKAWVSSVKGGLRNARSELATLKLEVEAEVRLESRSALVQATLGLDEGEAMFFVGVSEQCYFRDYPDVVEDSDESDVSEYSFSDELTEFKGDFSKEEMLREYERFLKTAYSGGGSSGGDWALGTIRASAKAAVMESSEMHLFPGGRYTLHHKVSQSHLKRIFPALEEAGAEADEFKELLLAIGADLLNGATNLKKILLSLPFNLEIGPPGDIRIGDPGSGFDGSQTPRSRRMRRFDDLTAQIERYWDEATGLLREAYEIHKEMLAKLGKDAVLTMPDGSKWEAVGKGKYRRV